MNLSCYSPYIILDMPNKERRKVLTYGRVNLSQSETSSSLLRGGWELKVEILVTTGGGVNRKNPCKLCWHVYNMEVIYFYQNCAVVLFAKE